LALITYCNKVCTTCVRWCTQRACVCDSDGASLCCGDVWHQPIHLRVFPWTSCRVDVVMWQKLLLASGARL